MTKECWLKYKVQYQDKYEGMPVVCSLGTFVKCNLQSNLWSYLPSGSDKAVFLTFAPKFMWFLQ